MVEFLDDAVVVCFFFLEKLLVVVDLFFVLGRDGVGLLFDEFWLDELFVEDHGVDLMEYV